MKKSIKKIALSTILLSSSFVLMLQSTKIVNAQGVSKESNKIDNLLTSNLVVDGDFENITKENTGAWDVDVSSEAAGSKGSFDVVSDAHSGSKAIILKGAGNDSGYPQISQKMKVLPNTTYYVTLRVKNNNTSMSSANLFFGFASEDRTSEIVYGEQHRWADNSVDKDKIYKTEDGTWSDHNGFSLFSARIKTKNETNVRFYIRVQKMNVTIDDVSVTYADSIVPNGKENLLKNSGFEESTSTDPLNSWEVINETTEGFSAGIDDVRTTSAYTAGSNMQDKQIEGCNTLYLVAQSGAEGSMSIAQGVDVKANTNYAFYANFSKWGEIKVNAGVQKVTIGILASDKETSLVKKAIDGADISLARYMLSSVIANVGENTKVYPYVTVETKGFGTYGAGLYVDECYFFETALNLNNKTNLLSNGELKGSSDGWYEVGGSSQLGWEEGTKQGKGYVSDGNIWLSQWSPLDGIVQSVNLKENTMYKITAYMRTYFDEAYGTHLKNQDGLYSPVSILVIEGDDETVSAKLYEDDSLANLNCVAKQNVVLERDDAYMPISLIFEAKENKTYSIFVGFEGGVYENTWQGGVQIGGVSLYETSMDELSVIEDDNNYDSALVNTSDDITISEGNITVNKTMSVSDFKDAIYTAPSFEMKLLDNSGNEVTTGNVLSGQIVKVYKNNEEVLSYTITVNAKEEPTTSDTTSEEPNSSNDDKPNENKKGCKGNTTAVGMTLLLASLVLIKKRQYK